MFDSVRPAVRAARGVIGAGLGVAASAAALAIALSGCGSGSSSTAHTDINPTTVNGLAVATSSNNGGGVTLLPGDTLQVKLPVDSAGYSWKVTREGSPNVQLVSLPTTEATSTPGGPSTQTTVFKAVSPGTNTVRLGYVTATGQQAKSWSITVHVPQLQFKPGTFRVNPPPNSYPTTTRPPGH
jgi:predicted secreted protein